MRAYTFYNPIKGHADAQPLIDMWRQSWEKNGWKTGVLTEEDAKQNLSYKAFCDRVDDLPTTNSRDYEHACYVRWLAMEMVDDSLTVLSDYDVINRSFQPHEAGALIENDNILMLEPTRVPCAVLGTPAGFSFICDEIERYIPRLSDQHRGKPHVSDMEILRKVEALPFENVCIEHLCSGSPIRDDPGDGWKKAPLIHFSSFSFIKQGLHGKHPKHWLIKNALTNLANEGLQSKR